MSAQVLGWCSSVQDGEEGRSTHSQSGHPKPRGCHAAFAVMLKVANDGRWPKPWWDGDARSLLGLDERVLTPDVSGESIQESCRCCGRLRHWAGALPASHEAGHPSFHHASYLLQEVLSQEIYLCNTSLCWSVAGNRWGSESMLPLKPLKWG